MGQHRIQRQILRNFSFAGRQINSRVTYCLNRNSYRPESQSIDRVGFFEVDCSEDVDKYITALEDKFKDCLSQFSCGAFAEKHVQRHLYDFIAMHYVRSHACRLQIEHVVRECQRIFGITQKQAETEGRRLTSHQDVAVFHDLVEGVSGSLTHYVIHPIVTTGPSRFVTSNRIMYAGKAPSQEGETFVWFPLSPSTGLCLISQGHAGQILGPLIEVNRSLGRITLVKLPEAEVLQCYEPTPQEGDAKFVDTLNGFMVQGSTELYATTHAAIDSALRSAEQPAGFQYLPYLI